MSSARLWNQKALAARAKAGNIDADPELGPRIAAEIERIYAQAQIQRIDAKAGAEFDARGAVNEARAREIYLTERKRFELPAQAKASHILFDTRKHTSDEAKALAVAARARIAAGGGFQRGRQGTLRGPVGGPECRPARLVRRDRDGPGIRGGGVRPGERRRRQRAGAVAVRLAPDPARRQEARGAALVRRGQGHDHRGNEAEVRRTPSARPRSPALRGPEVKVNQPAIDALYAPPNAEAAAAARRAFDERLEVRAAGAGRRRSKGRRRPAPLPAPAVSFRPWPHPCLRRPA